MKIKNQMKAILLSVLVLITCIFTSCGKQESAGGTYDVTHTVEMTVKGMGTIKLELYGNLAPKTVENFVSLAEDGFYDGLTFHRIVTNFVIQGGDPNGDGTGGSGKTIVGEFSANGYENDLSHDRGVISMARLGNNYDSATSQFFICLSGDYKSSLDGQYAAFGKVTEGMDTVDKISSVATNGNDKPLEDVVIESVKVTEIG